MTPELVACARLVETADKDRFAATMAAPSAARAVLWPLYAFNIELARAPYASSEPMVAQMRLQWWVDLVERIGSGGRAEGDVAHCLMPLIGSGTVAVTLLTRMAEARRWEAWREPFDNDAALHHYIDETAGNLMWAAALALGAPPEAEQPVRDFAFGSGLANWLAAVPELEARGRFPLLDGRAEAVAALAGLGLERIARARTQRRKVPASARPALWAGWCAQVRLKRAAHAPERVASGDIEPTPLRRGAALTWRAMTGYW